MESFPRSLVPNRRPEVVSGALPMANVLAVGLLIAQQRPGSRPFMLGFGAFGRHGVGPLRGLVELCFSQ